MPRRRFGALLVTAAIAVLLIATAGCSAGGSALGDAHEAAVALGRMPAATAASTRRIDVLSASFVSASAGWLLAERPCAHQADPCRAAVLMRGTVNGGRTWFAAPAPPASAADPAQPGPPRDAVGRVLFTSARDGWAFGPGLRRTTDGGTAWRRLRVPGPVAAFTVADDRMLAIVGGCGKAGNCAYRGYETVADSDTWRPVPGTAVAGSGGLSVQLVVSGSAGYVLVISQEPVRPVLLSGPLTGAARWRPLPLPQPCAGADSGGIAASGRWLFLGCGGEPGAGNQPKVAYLSPDGGRGWQRAASPPFSGYLGSAAMSPDGTIILSGQRMDVDISRDRGGSWHVSPDLATPAALADAGFPLLATVVTGAFAVAIQQGVSVRQVWLTGDDGIRWASVTVR